MYIFESPTRRRSRSRTQDGGQVTILLVGVVLAAAVAIVGLALIAQAMVDRTRARTAADAVALAAAVDELAASEVTDWYQERGAAVSRDGNWALASVGDSRAAAWATTDRTESLRTPALVAIMARANQLLATTIEPEQWDEFAIALSLADAARFRTVAPELGLCERAVLGHQSGRRTFALC